MEGEIMIKRILLRSVFILSLLMIPIATPAMGEGVDPYDLSDACLRFPFARVIPLDDGEAWGLIYADVYGKVFIKRATDRGWKREWELMNLGSKVRKFFILDLEQDGVLDMLVATMAGRLLIYRMDDYSNTWENIEDNWNSIEAIDVANIDRDPQVEFIVLAEGTLMFIDSADKSRQWISRRKYQATELLVANVDKDEQQEIILNTGIVIDSRFFQVDLEWDKPFGDRITTFDLNSDGIPEIIGEFSDYSLRIFDVYTQREVW
jgi:hypothetical protein